MPDPIGSCRPSASTDEVLHRTFDFAPGASALPTPDAAPDSAHEAPIDLHADHADHPSHAAHVEGAAAEGAMTALEVVEPLIEHAGLLGVDELGLASLPGAIAGQVLSVWGGLQEGDRRLADMETGMMQGVLARLEGRQDDPDVTARAAHDDGFRAGLSRADRVAHTPEFACAQQQIRAIALEGERAVLTGTDRGPAFERRYEHDLAFRHGVERARERRESAPAEHESRRREALELQRRMDEGRGAAAVRG